MDFIKKNPRISLQVLRVGMPSESGTGVTKGKCFLQYFFGQFLRTSGRPGQLHGYQVRTFIIKKFFLVTQQIYFIQVAYKYERLNNCELNIKPFSRQVCKYLHTYVTGSSFVFVLFFTCMLIFLFVYSSTEFLGLCIQS